VAENAGQDVVFEAVPARASATMHPPRIVIVDPMWPRWARLAIEFELASWKARWLAIGLVSDDRQYATAIGDEMQNSFQGIAAASHAIDGFYGAIRDFAAIDRRTLDAWRRNRTPRPSRILETLKRAFHVGEPAAGWGDAAQLPDLFRLRDAALHHAERESETSLHPLGTGVSQEAATYTAERASWAVELMLDVIGTCLINPRPNSRDYAERRQISFESTSARRTEIWRGLQHH
jgi:hypothetical protein